MDTSEDDTPKDRKLHYQLLLDCFRTGQMNDRQIQQHMAEDEAFRDFVRDALKRSRSSSPDER